MAKVDLHIHTSASDGRYSPAEIVRKAVAAGLSVMAITDHDTVAGIVPAMQAAEGFAQLRVIPGVEINTDVPTGEAHILGYFIDHTDADLLSALSKMRDSRQERGRKMVEKLAAMGMPLSWDRVKAIAGTDSIGRPHIAEALLEKGYISAFKEAFDKYIGWQGPAYVERAKMTQSEAAALIMRAQGLPVLAHPLTVGEPEPMIRELKQNGLVGIEVYYAGYSASDVSRLLRLAQKYDLVPTGGSDFHGIDEKAEMALGGSGVPLESAYRLIALAERRVPR